MLNKDGQRELAYVVKIDEIKPIPNYDRVEHARVGGWWVIVKKDQFQVGDPAIYIEVDSRVPEKEPFMFLEKKHFKVKTQKMCKVISQGLLMHPNDFGWDIQNDNLGGYVITTPGVKEYFEIGDFLTKKLEITYAEDSDNKRKAPSADKYKKMAQRRPDIFRQGWARWMMKRDWGKKVMFFFFGRKKDKKNGWPAWVVKTDEERCQNMPWLFPGNDEEWIATEKVDGTSTTFTMKDRGRKQVCYVCSRNVVFDTPEKGCYYDTNVYFEMFDKYNIKDVLTQIMNDYPDINFVTIQGETYGEGIQKRNYNLENHCFKAFNLIFGIGGEAKRFNPIEMTEILTKYGVPCVDIVDEHFKIPATCDELLVMAGGKSAIDGGMREGLVFRSLDGVRSFKAVSNEFLLKYHA
jgi:hypothetical protein